MWIGGYTLGVWVYVRVSHVPLFNIFRVKWSIMPCLVCHITGVCVCVTPHSTRKVPTLPPHPHDVIRTFHRMAELWLSILFTGRQEKEKTVKKRDKPVFCSLPACRLPFSVHHPLVNRRSGQSANTRFNRCSQDNKTHLVRPCLSSCPCSYLYTHFTYPKYLTLYTYLPGTTKKCCFCCSTDCTFLLSLCWH